MYYQVSSFKIPSDIFFTCVSVFHSPKGSLNAFKTRKNISLHFRIKHLIIYNYFFIRFCIFIHLYSQMLSF